MGFDVQNFGLGLLAGWASAYGIYRARNQISGVYRSARGQADSARSYATRSADSRYHHGLIEFCERNHLAGAVIPLSKVLIEPRFLPAPKPAAPPDDEVVHSVYHVIPQMHDLPHLHAPYNLETLSIEDLAAGEHAVALLGLPGSGRTTALLSIALHSLNQLSFQEVEDKIQRQLDEEEAALSEKERTARVKERQRIEERAREQLREEHGITFQALTGQKRQKVTAFQQRMPVYVHLANVTIDPAEFGEEIDPAEPLVRAVQSQLGRVTASTLPRHLYQRLGAGQALLLIDGYDDLPQAEQEQKVIWLRQLMREYPDNFYIVAGPARGYGALTSLGLAPVFMRPWDRRDIQDSVDHWADAWPKIASTGRRAAPRPEQSQIDRAYVNNHALNPLEVTLKTWATLADDTALPGYEGWLRSFIARRLPGEDGFDNLLPQLMATAATQLDTGFITGHPETSDTEQASDKKEESDHSKLLNMLERADLLVGYRGNRYQFRHPFVAAYLASLTLKEPEILLEKANQPAWEQAVAYAAMHKSVEPVIQERLSNTDDILQKNLMDTARWLAYTGTAASWSGALLKRLGNILIAQDQYPLTQERAAAALIGTRDSKVLFVFRQAARSANPSIRVLACLGMGAVGDPAAITDLAALLEDSNTDVQIAAGMALGAIGTDEALELMVISLTQGAERLRQAVAESMAVDSNEGHAILYDAITHEDMMVRRAAAFGLRRLRTNWAVHALYRAFLEDDQWYVSSAAQQAFQEIQMDERRGPHTYPTLENVPWLVNWAATRGESVPAGDGANRVLASALQEGPPEIRTLSATMIGQTGQLPLAKPLYNSLRDRQEEVRTAAHRSLAEIEAQLGKSMPAV
ncbi:MAG: HEAT repeat domain-containing protein [Anaerolineae bacterium]|nr:HEAT repeat domain-containing protein [Anaerolineae bacterium]